MLTEWRATWTFNKDSSGPAVAWSIVKTFFRWAHSIDLIPSDVSSKLKSLPIVRKQVQPLTLDEMARLLAATSQCGFAPEIAERVRIFILLQRWSGLACIDAATLPRNLLRADDNLTQVHRTKPTTPRTDQGWICPANCRGTGAPIQCHHDASFFPEYQTPGCVPDWLAGLFHPADDPGRRRRC
jgi:hypothetical protein